MSLYDGGIVDEIRIESDENGWELVVESQYGRYRFNIHGQALEFYAEVQRTLGEYAREAELARATMPPSYEPGDAYSADDPKHPDWHDAMADMWDVWRKGK